VSESCGLFGHSRRRSSRFQLLDQLAGLVLVRAGTDRVVSPWCPARPRLESRLAGKDNPGLSFYSGVAGVLARALTPGYFFAAAGR